MVVKINENYLKLKSSYLFVEVARREAEFREAHPDADVIKMGIGDVTKPLAPAVVEAFGKAVEEMGNADTFMGYGPEQGYEFLAEAIIKNDYNKYGIDLNYAFDRKNGLFSLTYNQDKEYTVPTEIYVHKKPEIINCDGEYTLEEINENGAAMLKITAAPGKHTVTIKF